MWAVYAARRWSRRNPEQVLSREYEMRDAWWDAKHGRFGCVWHQRAKRRRPYQHYVDNIRPKRWDLPW